MSKKTLGTTLKECRSLAGLTMRQVEESSQVSNAYLSQLENDKIKMPSANVLYKLATLYGVSIDVFLIAAGIIKEPDRSVESNILTQQDLTKEEEKKILEYLQFLRSK